MSLDAMDWVWEHSQSKGTARLVALAIADKANPRSYKAYAGLSFLQQRANAGRSTVIAALRELAASGEIEVVDGEIGPFGATVYRLPKALGHVRGTETQAGSVQESDRSEDCDGIGAETAPIDQDDEPPIGAESAPIEPDNASAIGAETAPIEAPGKPAEDDAAEPESVQILDSIGAETAPLHQHQEEVLRTSSKTTARKRASADAKKPAATKRTPKTAGTRIPDDFRLTPEMAAWGRQHYPHLDGEQITDEFTDYWRGIPDPKGLKSDWVATWRNRVRDVAKRQAATQTSLPATPVTRPADPWCGQCFKPTRKVSRGDDLVPCPRCSPHRRTA